MRSVSASLPTILSWVALGAVLGALLARWARRATTARLRQLRHAALRLADGDENARATEHPRDELGRVGHAINRLAADRRQRLESLERERDERERILTHMRDGVALIDPEGRVVRMNRGFAMLLGKPAAAGAGSPFREFVRSAELEELIAGARGAGRAVETDLRLWLPGLRTVHATATPLQAPNRESVLLVLHDLSEIERLNRMRQDFVANVSHELRTPLTSLRGYAETLLDGGLDDPEHREHFVRVIRDQAVRLEALAEDLLSLADLERPGLRLRLARFDLREVIERQLASFRPRAEMSGLSLALVPGAPLPVRADRVLLEQVVANLLDNAIKYTESGGVSVATGRAGGRAWCEVADTGAGIPLDDQPRIFERFYRVDKARSREKGGTGLGLSIVKHVLVLHGGEVQVRSTLGKGTVFRFEIPVDGPATGATTVVSEVAADS